MIFWKHIIQQRIRSWLTKCRETTVDKSHHTHECVSMITQIFRSEVVKSCADATYNTSPEDQVLSIDFVSDSTSD